MVAPEVLGTLFVFELFTKIKGSAVKLPEDYLYSA